jgi:hypothetical protein
MLDMEATIAALVERQLELERQLDELKSRQEITDVVYRCARGTDRADIDARGEGSFHRDATDYRGVGNGPYKNMLSISRQFQPMVTMHNVTNIQIQLDGNVAKVESYVIAFHVIKEADGSTRDEFLRARYLDRMERRDGVWKIARRITLWEWSRIEPSKESWFETVNGPGMHDKRFIFGRRDKDDISYSFRLPEDLRHHEPD